jgi:hypothetical protein
MDNIIPFPKNKIVAEHPRSVEEIDDRMLNLKNEHVNETLATVIPMLFSWLEVGGFDFSMLEEDQNMIDPFVKDGAFVVESVRSLLFKYYDMNHPFQKIADTVFIKDMENEGVFNLVKKLDIELNDVEKGNS